MVGATGLSVTTDLDSEVEVGSSVGVAVQLVDRPGLGDDRANDLVPSSVGGIRVPQAPEVCRFSVPVRVCRGVVLGRLNRIQGDASGGSRADVGLIQGVGRGDGVLLDVVADRVVGEVAGHRPGDRNLIADVGDGTHGFGRDAGGLPVACN